MTISDQTAISAKQAIINDTIRFHTLLHFSRAFLLQAKLHHLQFHPNRSSSDRSRFNSLPALTVWGKKKLPKATFTFMLHRSKTRKLVHSTLIAITSAWQYRVYATIPQRKFPAKTWPSSTHSAPLSASAASGVQVGNCSQGRWKKNLLLLFLEPRRLASFRFQGN